MATQIEMKTPASAAVGRTVIQPSKLLPSLFRSLNVDRRLNILDVGAALPETVEFFSRFKCRIHFIDLFSEPVVRELQQVSDARELQHQFEKLLRPLDLGRLDICLLWDLLCYLDDPALRAFNSALRPYMYNGTRAHGFGVHHLAIRLENKQYGIMEEDALSVRLRQAEQLATHPHSQVEMHEMLSCFDFERGLMLPDGKLELLLRARDGILES
jgi:hypothetical protein